MLERINSFIRKCTISCFVVVLFFSFCPLTEAFSPQVIQRGATGDDVIELQARLQYIGYYKGKIDGVYSWGTYWAVRNYQNDFGIKVDGLVGQEMKKKLLRTTKYNKKYVFSKIAKGKKFNTYGKTNKGPKGVAPPGKRDPNKNATKQAPKKGGKVAQKQPAKKINKAPTAKATGQLSKAVNIPDGFTTNDLKLMANAVYGEARGEPYEGQVAIAAVILNRVKNAEFPNTVAGVIFEPGAFTAVADGQIWLTPNETAKRAVIDAINGWDPTGGLVFYFNPDTATNKWMFSRQRVKRIGRHVFLR